MAGARAPEREPEDFEPGWVRGQHEASSRVHRRFQEMDLFPRMTESSRALVRSQAGPGGGVAVHMPNVQAHTIGIPSLQGALDTPPPAASLSDRVQLPGWPLPRCLWPPPRSLRTGRGAEQNWLHFGKRHSTCVPRGRRARQHARSCQRSGLGSPGSGGRTQTGSGS